MISKDLEIGSYLFIRLTFDPTAWAVGVYAKIDGVADDLVFSISLGPFLLQLGADWAVETEENGVGFRMEEPDVVTKK